MIQVHSELKKRGFLIEMKVTQQPNQFWLDYHMMQVLFKKVLTWVVHVKPVTFFVTYVLVEGMELQVNFWVERGPFEMPTILFKSSRSPKTILSLGRWWQHRNLTKEANDLCTYFTQWSLFFSCNPKHFKSEMLNPTGIKIHYCSSPTFLRFSHWKKPDCEG